MSDLRERLIAEVFALNTMPKLSREQWAELAEQQGGLTEAQVRLRETNELIAELIADLGAHITACENESQLTREALTDWLRDYQLACELNSPADVACTMVQVYMKLWVDYA